MGIDSALLTFVKKDRVFNLGTKISRSIFRACTSYETELRLNMTCLRLLHVPRRFSTGTQKFVKIIVSAINCSYGRHAYYYSILATHAFTMYILFPRDYCNVVTQPNSNSQTISAIYETFAATRIIRSILFATFGPGYVYEASRHRIARVSEQ